jgi:hypothetical protein
MAVLKTTSPSPRTSAVIVAVLLGDEDLDALGVRSGHVLADVIRSYRQLAMAAVDEHRQLDRPRAPEVHESVHGRARGAAVVDDVVHQHNHLAVDVGDIRLPAVRRHAQVKVVSVLADVQRADSNRRALELHQAVGEPACEVVALGHDAHDHQVAGAAVPLQDLVSDPRQRPPDLLTVHHRRLEPSLLYCAHDSMADPPAAARDSVHRWSRWEEPTSTGANASWNA